MTSAFERFYSTKPCGDHLNVYGAPIRYHVKLHTMGRDDKFDEHALPGFYVGPSPENPEEKYVWTGTRHISVGGSFVIDESRFLKPIHLRHFHIQQHEIVGFFQELLDGITAIHGCIYISKAKILKCFCENHSHQTTVIDHEDFRFF